MIVKFLQTSLTTSQHYKIRFGSELLPSQSVQSAQSPLNSANNLATWTEVSDSSRAPNFSSEGYQVKLLPKHHARPTATELHITVYGASSRSGTYVVTGTSSLSIRSDSLDRPLPLSLFQLQENINPSEIFASLFTIIQHPPTAETFRQYLGRKKTISFDLDLHSRVATSASQTGGALERELLKIAQQFNISLPLPLQGGKSDGTIDLLVLRSIVEGSAEQARARLAGPFAVFVKKKSKKLIKSMEKLRKKKKNPTLYFLNTKVGELVLRLEPIIKPSVEEVLKEEGVEGEHLLHTLEGAAVGSTDSETGMDKDRSRGSSGCSGSSGSSGSSKVSSSSASASTSPNTPTNGRVYVMIHGLKSTLLKGQWLRAEGRIVQKSADTLLRTKLRVNKGRGYSKLMRRVLEVVQRTPPADTEIYHAPGAGGSSVTAAKNSVYPSTFLSVPYNEYDSNNDSVLRLDVMDASDVTDPWPSRGGVSIPLRRLLPDVQYDMNVQVQHGQLDSICFSVMSTQTREERRRHADDNRGAVRPEIMQLHLSSLVLPNSMSKETTNLHKYRRFIGVVSLLTDSQVRQFRKVKRKSTMGGGDADIPPFLHTTANELLAGEEELQQLYPSKCDGLDDMRCTTILPVASAFDNGEITKPWKTTLSFPLSSDNLVTKACIELYCDDTGVGAAVDFGAIPHMSLGHFMMDITAMKDRTNGGVVEVMSNEIVLDQPLNDQCISSMCLCAYGRMWSGESYGAVGPKYVDPAYVMKYRRPSKDSGMKKQHAHLQQSDGIGNESTAGGGGDGGADVLYTGQDASRPNSVEEAIREERVRTSLLQQQDLKAENHHHHHHHTLSATASDAFSSTSSTSASTSLPTRKKSLYSYSPGNIEDSIVNHHDTTIQSTTEHNSNYKAFPMLVNNATNLSIIALQARHRGYKAREKVVELLLVDRRLRTLKRRATQELSGLEDIQAMNEELERSDKKLQQSINVRNESVRKMRVAESARSASLEMMEEIQKQLEDAKEKSKAAEDRLRSAEETIIGCDEMLVERDKKVARLEAEVRSLKYDKSPKRSPALLRGQGGGGGAGVMSSANQQTPNEMAQELEAKTIQIERLSAKLEHSEQIINRMIHATTGGGTGVGGGRRSVPQLMRDRGGGGGGSGRRKGRRYLASTDFDDY